MARPVTTFHRWPQADEKAVAATPLPIDDGSEAWWSGAQLCFVQLAIAGAAATLANTAAIAGSFQFNDDRPTPAGTLQVDEVYEWEPSVIQGIPPQPRVWAEDERIAPAAFTPVDDDPQVQVLSTAAANFIVWVTDDSFVPQSSAVALDDGAWQLPAIAPAAPFSRVWVEADDFATNFALPEDDWQQPAPRLPGPFTQTWVDEAIAFATPTLTVDESYWQQPFLAQPVPDWAQQFDDDLVVPQPSPLSEEDYWLRLYSVTVDPVVRLWNQQDETPTAATPLQVDEVYWQQPPTWPVLPARPASAADDEIVPQVVIDEVYWLQPALVPAFVAAPARSADDEIVPQPIFRPVEDYWLRFFSVTVYPLGWVETQQDEVPTVPAPVTVILSAPPVGHRIQTNTRPAQTAPRRPPQRTTRTR